MKCQICNINEATVHVTEVINGEVVEMHICEECAQEKSFDINPEIPFNDILAGLVDFTSKNDQPKNKLKCKTCGMSYESFKKNGRLGCEDCYESFKRVVMPLIKRVQGATHNMGKVPASMSGKAKIDMEIRELQEKLKKHVANEEFEEAAQLRDKIRQMESARDEQLKKGNDE